MSLAAIICGLDADRAVFVDGELIGFCTNRAHQSDIGGGAAGTYNAAATEIFHEGIRLPVLKLVAKGELRDDLWRLAPAQFTLARPDGRRLGAMLGSTRIGAERVADIARQLGTNRANAYFDALLDHGEKRMRQAIAALPDGCWEGKSDTERTPTASRLSTSRPGSR